MLGALGGASLSSSVRPHTHMDNPQPKKKGSSGFFVGAEGCEFSAAKH
jgi:hypothetical protein